MDESYELQNPDFEREFGALLDKSRQFGETVHTVVDGLLPPNISWEDVPFSTLHRINLPAIASYQSIIQCLRQPVSGVGGFILLRGLLESWAHADFVLHDEGEESRQERALRFEIGAIREKEDTYNRLPVDPEEISEDRAELAEWRRFIISRWRSINGVDTIPPWGRRDVARHLDSMTNRDNFVWPIQTPRSLFSATSLATHMYNVEMLTLERDGVSVLVWSTPAHRSTWLQCAVITLSYIAATQITHMGGVNASVLFQVISNESHAIVDSSILKSTIEGWSG